MPEGPEIRRAADSIAEVLEGQLVNKVFFGLPRLRRHARQLRGQRVVEIETRGKAMLTHFDHGLSIYSHNQLYGVWRVIAGHRLPDCNRSVRLLLQTSSHSAVLYSASDISVWKSADLPEHPFLRKLGPDIMSPLLDWRAVAARLREPRFQKRELAALYLDQAFLAGNGNYLRSEILHDAGLDPRCRPADLSRGELGRLARSTLALSRRFYVFGRTDQPCHHCAAPVLRTEVGARRLYHCPVCQPAVEQRS